MVIKHVRKFEDLPTPRHTAIMAEIEDQKQADRAVAIIGAAYVDLVLRYAITAVMLPDQKLMKDLFEDRGPLQEFGSRIQIAFALKICGDAARRDLRTIKEIRNAFAHSAEALDFTHEDIARSCHKLWYPTIISYSSRPDPETPRQQYVRTIALLADLLLEDIDRRKNGIASHPLIIAPGPSGMKSHKKRS
jgi:hypothetical protein